MSSGSRAIPAQPTANRDRPNCDRPNCDRPAEQITGTSTVPSVAICIITYHRPAGLIRLLEGLEKLTFETLSPPDLQVIIIDNDAEGSTYRTCLQRRPSYRWPLICGIEPRRGISFARNSAVALVSPQSDFIAFIDDDEIPAPQWLEQLLLVQQHSQDAAVLGPVSPRFSPETPDWVEAGAFFAPPERNSGDRIAAAYTHNVLVQAHLLTRQSQPFEPRFALTGGEDSYFFRNLNHEGHALVWAAEAVVEEWVPPSRTRLSWLLQRNYRSCLTYCLWEKHCHPQPQVRLLSLGKAIASILRGCLRLVPALLRGKQHQAKALIDIARGLGRIAGQLNWSYQEYNTIHGSEGTGP